MANTSTSSITPLAQPSSTDPDLCTISGFLRNLQGEALKGWSIVIRSIYDPTGIAPDTMILQERLSFQADATGFMEFELLRGATVRVELPNLLNDFVLEVVIPDAASANLVDVLLPHVLSVAFVDTSPLAVAIDTSVEIALEATLSNGQVVAVPSAAVVLLSDAEAVLTKLGGLVFRGLAAGGANVSVDSFDPDKIELRQTPAGGTIPLFDTPAVTLPADLVVTVS
jgi:hypothetical protein